MKKQKYHTVRSIPKSNRRILEIEVKSIPLTLKDMPAHL